MISFNPISVNSLIDDEWRCKEKLSNCYSRIGFHWLEKMLRVARVISRGVSIHTKVGNSFLKNTTIKRFNSSNFEQKKTFWFTVFRLWKNIAARYAIITGVVVGVLYIAWKVFSFFGALSFDDVGKWSFYAGFISAMSLVLIFSLYKRQYSYKTSQVFTEAFNRASRDASIKQMLGEPIIPGKFKAYGYEMKDSQLGDFDQGYHTYILNYIKQVFGFGKQTNLQMLFQLNGAKRMAIVSCEVSKLPGLTTVNNLNFQSLSVDVFHKDPSAKPGVKARVILEGTEADVVEKQNSLF